MCNIQAVEVGQALYRLPEHGVQVQRRVTIFPLNKVLYRRKHVVSGCTGNVILCKIFVNYVFNTADVILYE